LWHVEKDCNNKIEAKTAFIIGALNDLHSLAEAQNLSIFKLSLFMRIALFMSRLTAEFYFSKRLPQSVEGERV
jgi:hypothetical protein